MGTKENGYIKAAAVTLKTTVADCEKNSFEIIKYIDEARCKNVDVSVFPELSVTGYTCSDLFMQKSLIDGALESLIKISDHLKMSGQGLIAVVGLPIEYKNSLYNCAAVLQDGKILGVVPKTYLPTYSEFYEGRHFSSGFGIKNKYLFLNGQNVPFGTDLIFCSEKYDNFRFAVEICEDLWAPEPPSGRLAMNGATVILNLSASNETIGKADYRRNLVKCQSGRLLSAYVYADAGEGESTTDTVYAGHNIIAENGIVLKESERFSCGMITAHIDTELLAGERRRIGTFKDASRFSEENAANSVREIFFADREYTDDRLNRFIDPMPFVPSNSGERTKRCREILDIQTAGLKKRLEHIGLESAVVGISGGLDSTLALLVTVRAFDSLGIDREGITAVTMPCFGTTDRTYNNAVRLCEDLGVTLREINIAAAVRAHFKDIGHDENNRDVTYENSQARERTQVLMDVANQTNGIVIGTGDLSELALGWATYNGDHMSMYGVNASIPKTLIKYIIEYFAIENDGGRLAETLRDILDTPVSPELLPPEDGKISQKTENIVGPYELHDFFLYNMMRLYYKPSKILFLAKTAFGDKYGEDEIKKWLTVFYRRFFSQQFKRSCLPDGPKVGSVSLSPRGDFRMPSDASADMWLKDI